MTVARGLADFSTGISSAYLPPQAVEHAAMLIASTLASAAMGAGLESSAIIRELARDRAGSLEASVWFDAGPKLPASDAARVNAVMSDATASEDSAGTAGVQTVLRSFHTAFLDEWSAKREQACRERDCLRGQIVSTT